MHVISRRLNSQDIRLVVLQYSHNSSRISLAFIIVRFPPCLDSPVMALVICPQLASDMIPVSMLSWSKDLGGA